jgi:Ser/Thr protein kinase RdoA (MazF antagonist)
MKPDKKLCKKICKKLNAKFISADFLGKGSHNENYILNTDRDRFVLRIDYNLQFDNIEEEYKFLKKTGGVLGPKVYLFDDSKKILDRRYLVEEFIEGTHPKKVDNQLMILMGKWYKKLHKNRIKRKVRPLSKRDSFIRYKKFKHILDKNKREELDKLFSQTKEILDKYNYVFKNVKYLSLNHGDPSRMNVFYDGKSVRLIDWEFVHYNLPEADLTFFVWSYNLNEKQKKLFLDSYGYPKTDHYNKRFNLKMLAHLWGMISWRLERLDLVKKGKLSIKEHSTSKKEAYIENSQDISNLERILGELK